MLLASLVTAAVVMLAISAWQLRRGRDRTVFRPTAKLALVVLVPAIFLEIGVGSELGVIEADYQPMKIAAAEAQWTTCQPCSFSLFQIGGGNNDQTPTKIIAVPHLLSLLATNSWNGKVEGLNEVNSQYQQEYGPGNYVPNVFVQYWSMRAMAYSAVVIFLVGLWGLWLWRRKRLGESRLFLWAAAWSVPLVLIMNTSGWMLTENGRQPWIVQGIMLTKQGVSPSTSTAMVATSIILFLLLYIGLGIVDVMLMMRYARREIAPPPPETDGETEAKIPAMTY